MSPNGGPMGGSVRLPSGRAGQMLALGILGVALVTLWLGAGAPLRDWYADRAERVDQQRLLVARMTEVAAVLPELMGRAGGGTVGAGIGETDALIAAGLQQRLMHLAAEAGTEIASAETLAPEQADGLKRIRLRVTLRAPLPQLLKLLRAIETDAPPLLIDDLDLRTDAAPDPDAPALEARFSVITLRAGTASAAAP
jgi:general secretion pathway protein M